MNAGFGGSNAVALLEEPPSAESLDHSTTSPLAQDSSQLTNGYSPLTNGYTNGIVNGIETLSADDPANGFRYGITKKNTNGDINSITIGHISKDQQQATDSSRVFVFSARSDVSLSTYLSTFSRWLDENKETPELFHDLSFTLCSRRTHFPYRFAAVADSFSTLQQQIRSFSKSTRSRAPVVAFVFTGQGAQYAGMAAGLGCYKPFRDTIDQAEECLYRLGATWSLKEELNRPDQDSRINEVGISQAACTAVQIALVRLLEHWGIQPSIVTGHSSGEIGSAYAAGMLSLEAALAVAYYRGIAARQIVDDGKLRGAMVVVGLSADDAEMLIQQHLVSGYATIAALNGPGLITISGDERAIEAIQKTAEERRVFVRRLPINVAYHSRHMDKVATTYLTAITPRCNGSKSTGRSKVKFISSVTGRAEDVDALGSSYWVVNLMQPVRFMDAVSAVASIDNTTPTVLLELGPHGALKTVIKDTLEKAQVSNITYLPTLVRGTSARQAMLSLAASLYTLGTTLNFREVNERLDAGRNRVLTDLPAYEWNKSIRYIQEHRITKQKQQPGHAYHPLLGWKSPYSEGRDHSFRQIFSLDEMSWICDHDIDNNATFPMTGWICMAVAALKALRPSTGASMVRNFHAKRGLRIQQDERVEMITKLTPVATGTEGYSSTSWTFEISTWRETSGWSTHCYGIVEPDANEDITQSPTMLSRIPLASSPNLRTRDAAKEYALLAKNGMRYEGIFKTMYKLSTSPGLTISETQARRPDGAFTDTTTVDPPMLDALAHCAPVTAAVAGEENIRHTYMPISFSRMRIPASLPTSNDHHFTTIMELVDRDAKAGDFRIRLSVFRHDEQNGRLQPVVEWEDVQMKMISRRETVESMIGPMPNAYHFDTMPSIDFWTVDTIQSYVATGASVSKAEMHNANSSDEVARYYMSRSLDDIVGEDLAAYPGHLKKCVQWFRRTVAAQAVVAEEEARGLISVVSNSGAHGELLCLVGENLTAILRGQLQPLEILMKDGLLSRGYEEDPFYRSVNSMLGKYVLKLVQANPFLRVLEIGAGTGSSTAAILEALLEEGGPELYQHVEYTYTDISTGFFENAQAKLAAWTDQITFKKLDITRDPLEQGFILESYDLIVASNVFHATQDMHETLRNTRSLLRPDGQLALVECTAVLAYHLAVATLPGWWLAEDEYRSDDGPLLSEVAWDRALHDMGFAGVELAAGPDIGTHQKAYALISSTRVDVASPSTNTDKTTQDIIVWGEFTDDSTTQFAQSLATQLSQNHGRNFDVRKLQDVETYNEGMLSRCRWSIVIDDSSKSIFEEVTEARFEHIHKLLSKAGGLLWVIPEQHTPESTVAEGMFKVLRQEDPSRWIVLFQRVPLNHNGMARVTELLLNLDKKEASTRQDQDFVFNTDTNVIEVPRLRMLKDAKTIFYCDAGVPPRAVQEIKEAAGTDALELTIDAAGSLDTIYFRPSPILTEPLGREQVIVRVEAVGVNFRDLLLILGTIPWMAPGFEGAGVVTHVGADVANVMVGDHVFFIASSGAFATHVRIPSLWTSKIPSGTLSSVEAASMPMAYSTAFMALRRTANLRNGESVLIHAASGAVGQACIALAQAHGAEIFVTAGSVEKREFLHQTFGVPKSHIFSSRTPDFRDGILSATSGRGVDVIVNSLSGPLLQETWSIIAEFGRFVELGRKDFLENSHLAMKHFDRNVTFSGIEFQKYYTLRPEIVAECFTQLIEGMASGVVRPVAPVHEIPVSDIATALRKLQSGLNVGKLVVIMGQHDHVMAERTSPLGGPSNRLLRVDATYLITGGTGGIGRSLARWMFMQGASNVVLLGRTGSSRPGVAQLLEEFKGQKGKCLRAVTCNVASRSDLQAALDSIADLPDVCGIVHGALYLNVSRRPSVHTRALLTKGTQDALFANATYDDWVQITDPKIRAAWNLHHLCPNLDFFVTLGSVAGLVGHMGQSIYAGTSTFLDAFVDYRLSHGLPASNITIPIVHEVGYAADRGVVDSLESVAGVTMTQSQLHTTVKAAIIGDSSGVLVHGKALVAMISKIPPSAKSYTFPLSITALQRRYQSSTSSNATTGTTRIDRGRARDLPALVTALLHKVASMTLMEPEEVEADQPLAQYGLDSLVSVELRNWIRKEVGVDIPLARIVSAESLQVLAETVWLMI